MVNDQRKKVLCIRIKATYVRAWHSLRTGEGLACRGEDLGGWGSWMAIRGEKKKSNSPRESDRGNTGLPAPNRKCAAGDDLAALVKQDGPCLEKIVKGPRAEQAGAKDSRLAQAPKA